MLFETFQEVPNMKPCRKLPVIVHSLQVNEPFRVKSLEGNYKQDKAGDYLMRGIDGELYICDKDICDKDIYERTYEYVD